MAQEFHTAQELAAAVGKSLGASDWLTVEQQRIDCFADATDDHQWIHVDVERASAGPFANTIAHGYLTLSLIAGLRTFEIKNRSRGINYGSNKVRFTNPVPAGSRVRLRQRITNVEEIPGNGVRVTSDVVVEIEDQDRPALVGELIGLRYA